MRLFLHSFDSPLGRFSTLTTATHLVRVMLPGLSESDVRSRLVKRYPDLEMIDGGETNERAEVEILEYLEGRRRRFEIPYQLDAPLFHVRALTEVNRIPYGKTATYGEIAETLGSRGLARAVGTANARNPLPIIIPCHRVVASNGLGGYGGGSNMKIRLLNIERCSLL